MKHAFLIIAHNEPKILKVLLSMLDDKRNDVYLHIDKRSEKLYQEFASFSMKEGKLNVIDNRLKVYWGDISQVETEYLLFETALKQGPYAYYHLLSGVDLPIQSQDHIHAFFKQNEGKEFVSFWLDKHHERDLKRKVNRYHFYTQHLKSNKTISHHLTSPIRNLSLGVQKVIGFSRKHAFNELKKGSNWVSITQDFCLYLVNQKKLVLREFRYTLCPDEIFLQTVLWNSPFKEQIYNLNDPDKGSMRKIDWNRGAPYDWQNNDFNELQKAEELFARKFSYSNKIIISQIYNHYKQV